MSMSYVSADDSSVDSLLEGSQTSRSQRMMDFAEDTSATSRSSTIRQHRRPAPRPLPPFGSLTLPDPNQSHLPSPQGKDDLPLSSSQEGMQYYSDYENNKENFHTLNSQQPRFPQHLNPHLVGLQQQQQYSSSVYPHPTDTIDSHYLMHDAYQQKDALRLSGQNPLQAQYNNNLVAKTPMRVDHLQQTPMNHHPSLHPQDYPVAHTRYETHMMNTNHIPQHHALKQSINALPIPQPTGYLSMSGINQTTKEKLYRDFQTQQEQKQLEQQLKYQLEANKETLIEQYALTEERLRQELMDQQKRYEHLLAEKDHSYSMIIEEKDKQYKLLKDSLEQKQSECKENLVKKDNYYIEQMKEIESNYQSQIQQTITSHKEQLQKIQQQMRKDDEMKMITDKAKIEAKEREILSKYEKKMKKYGDKIEKVIETYRVKELKMTGALEEARREIIHLQANFESKEQSLREELMLKDRRLIQIQQRLDSVDDLAKVADTWRETAKDLASIVIRTCATAEDLPPELWSSTTPGLFTTVWDDLQHLKASHASSTTGKVSRNDDIAETYAKKRKEYIMASRVLMSKCLKFSKSIHERIKAEVVISSPPPHGIIS